MCLKSSYNPINILPLSCTRHRLEFEDIHYMFVLRHKDLWQEIPICNHFWISDHSQNCVTADDHRIYKWLMLIKLNMMVFVAPSFCSPFFVFLCCSFYLFRFTEKCCSVWIILYFFFSNYDVYLCKTTRCVNFFMILISVYEM